MEIRNSREDYLEAVLMLAEKNTVVRSVDIAEHMGFSKASVSRAMAQLAEVGLVRMDEDKFVHLTDEGQALAEKVYEKHLFFKELLKNAGVEEPMASEDACKIEHAISDESFQAIKTAFMRNHGKA